MHNRDFVEYHSDRFLDHSLIVKKGEHIVALVPAHKAGAIVHSHQGLTYGGILLSRKQKTKDTLEIVKAILLFLESQGILRLSIKPAPHFYMKQPSEEIAYVLQLLNANCYRIDTASVIDNRDRLPIQSNRVEGVRKAQKKGLIIKEEAVFNDFWQQILVPNLTKKYQSKPTHTLEEIVLLQHCFSNNIRQFNVYDGKEIVGGTTIFETSTVAHVQYISGNDNKQELGTLDFLFHYLITDIFAHKRYFDFGISNENQGKNLNSGLSYWKECFGARTFVHRHYEVETKNHSLLNDVLI